MQCPLCKTAMRIQSNKLVRRSDGSVAYRMDLVCRNKGCENNGKVVKSLYDPVNIVDDEPSE